MQWILVIYAPSAGDHNSYYHKCLCIFFQQNQQFMWMTSEWFLLWCFRVNLTNIHILSLIVSQFSKLPCYHPQVWPWSWWMRWQGLLLLVIARPTLWPHLWTPLTSIARSRKVIKKYMCCVFVYTKYKCTFHCNIENIVGTWFLILTEISQTSDFLYAWKAKLSSCHFPKKWSSVVKLKIDCGQPLSSLGCKVENCIHDVLLNTSVVGLNCHLSKSSDLF